MKKFYSILIGLLLLTSLQGQILRYSNYTLSTPPVEDTTNYYSVYKTIYDVMSDAPGHDTAHFQSAMVYSLDTCDFAGGSSLWDRMDFLYILATKDSTDAMLNWSNTSVYTLTNPGSISLTFTQYDGITGDFTEDYLSTGYNPSTDSLNVGNNDVTLGTYMMTNNTGGYALGVLDNGGKTLRMAPSTSANVLGSRMNDGTTWTTANASSVGLALATRRSNVEVEHYMNGTSLGTNTAVETLGLPNGDIYILCYNAIGTPTTFTDGKVSIIFAMNAITDAEATALTTIFETYMDAIGAGIP